MKYLKKDLHLPMDCNLLKPMKKDLPTHLEKVTLMSLATRMVTNLVKQMVKLTHLETAKPIQTMMVRQMVKHSLMVIMKD